jgi:hypothetical protein
MTEGLVEASLSENRVGSPFSNSAPPSPGLVITAISKQLKERQYMLEPLMIRASDLDTVELVVIGSSVGLVEGRIVDDARRVDVDRVIAQIARFIERNVDVRCRGNIGLACGFFLHLWDGFGSQVGLSLGVHGGSCFAFLLRLGPIIISRPLLGAIGGTRRGTLGRGQRAKAVVVLAEFLGLMQALFEPFDSDDVNVM